MKDWPDSVAGAAPSPCASGPRARAGARRLSRNSRSNSSIWSNGTDVLLQLAFSLGSQQFQSPLQLALHRGQRRAQRSRNLFRRQVFLVAKNDRRALRLRQRGQQSFNAAAEGRITVKLLGQRAWFSSISTHWPKPRARRRRSASVDRLMATRRSQKQACCGLSILPKFSVQSQKNILSNLFGQAAVAGHAQRQRKDHGLVLVKKPFEVRELFEAGLPVGGHTAVLQLH